VSVASELVEAIIGSLFAATGLVAAVAGLGTRPRRERAAVWYGVFCVLYGVRMGVRSDLVQAVIPWPPPVFHYIDAIVTYTILVPVGLLVESIIGPGRFQIVRRVWQFACVYAAGAVLNDVVRGVPYASMWLNAPVLLSSLALQLTQVRSSRRSALWSPEARWVAAATRIFIVVAVAETLLNRSLFGGQVDAEPFAMLLLTGTVGWLVLARAREQAYNFVALSRELEVAREIQRSLLPQDMPDLPGLRIRGTYLPMTAVAGDFYDVVIRPDGRTVIIVADVSGHGVPAALVAAMVKVAFAAESERCDRPGDILGGINRTLTGKFDRAYVTACCVVVDRPRKTLAYAAAGHPPALLRRADDAIERIHHGGIVLTLFPDAEYTTVDHPFMPGDCLLLFTDGLLEATRGQSDEFFGDAELEHIVARLRPPADVTYAVLDAHRRWIGPAAALTDDVTLVVVDCVQMA
jgi:sigma-B regulation protein RsbU (phosphoserine phosphatase)